MNLKTFMQENSVTAFEVVKDTIVVNVMVGETPYGLRVDMSNIPFGTKLVRIENFTTNGDILTIDGLEINAEQTDIL
jgi:hypothetical protein